MKSKSLLLMIGTIWAFLIVSHSMADVATLGAFRPANPPTPPTFFLKWDLSGGYSDITLYYGEVGDLPIVGDWDGNSTTTHGVFRPSNATFYLRNSLTPGPSDINVNFGNPTDLPIAGDWDGNGTVTIGVYRPSTGRFYLRNSNSNGPADMSYGLEGAPLYAKPIVGDWTGKGYDTVGVYLGGWFYLKNSHGTGPADITISFWCETCKPVAGDVWGKGIDTIGLFRDDNATFYLKYENTTQSSWYEINYGNPGFLPLLGDWNGEGALVTAYNLESKQAGLTGYAFGDTDGTYIYPAPCYRNDGDKIHGKAVRYNTHFPITAPSSWEVINLPYYSGFSDAKGFHGTAVAGNYVYYAPLWKQLSPTGVSNGTVVRYNRNGDFTLPDSWEHYDVSTLGTLAGHNDTSHSLYYPWIPYSERAKGFVGCVTDGQYVYFVPYGQASPDAYSSGLMLRHRIDRPLSDEGAWEWINLPTQMGNDALREFHLAGFDGRWVYYAGFSSDGVTFHGNIVRYDTTNPQFNQASSWQVINLQTALGPDAKGFYGAITAPGKTRVYFPSNVTNVVARFNIYHPGGFTSPDAWSLVNIKDIMNSKGLNPNWAGGYAGGAWISNQSGDQIVLAPDFNVNTWDSHGVVAIHKVPFSLDDPYGWNFEDLTQTNGNLHGFHGAVYLPQANTTYFIPVRHVDYPTNPVYDGWFTETRWEF